MDEKTIKINEKLKESCVDVIATFEKLGLEQFTDLQGRIQWCVGSYEFDNNPEGLNELGLVALSELKSYKKENPRKVTKKVIEGLEKSLKAYKKATK